MDLAILSSCNGQGAAHAEANGCHLSTPHDVLMLQFSSQRAVYHIWWLKMQYISRVEGDSAPWPVSFLQGFIVRANIHFETEGHCTLLVVKK